MAPLGQIGKRLQIIKIAISITDEETVNMQRSKLRLHKNNKLLDNILSVLDDENYAQASNLIDRYIHGPYGDDSVLESEVKRDTRDISLDAEELKEKKVAREKEESDLIKKFGLFMDEANSEEYNPINEEEMLMMTQTAATRTVPSEETGDQQTPVPKRPTTEEIVARYDAAKEEKLPPKESADTTSAAALNQKIDEILTSDHDKKSAADSSLDHTSAQSDKKAEEMQEDEGPKEKAEEVEETEELQMADESEEAEKAETAKENVTLDEPIEYAPISYIDQKIRNMLNQYPQVEESSEQFKSEEKLLYMISLEGYTEADIEKTIDEVFNLKKEGKLAESAHLLLIAASTESLYAQFVLARELYRGEILQKDLPEAFTQINRLALDDYPEAVCDLAQFYERGIGIDKDKKKAFSLYEDALELGVERANTHLNRMEEESKGILGKLFGR